MNRTKWKVALQISALLLALGVPSLAPRPAATLAAPGYAPCAPAQPAGPAPSYATLDIGNGNLIPVPLGLGCIQLTIAPSAN